VQYFSSNFSVSVLGLWHALWEFMEQLPVILKVTWIISFVIQVDQGSPCIGTHEPA